MIHMRGVSKSYGDSVVLGPIDLDFPQGGLTALVGPNGAGKSTLLTIAGRLLEPTTGTVTVAGMDVKTTKSRDLAKVISVLRQENHFVTRLTVEELVGMGRFPHSGGRKTEADRKHVESAIEFLDLNDYRGRFLDQLSGGQRQRAYVAMVLAQDTEYVLLDEPLNNLDMRHAVSMMSRLRDAADQFGKTFVVVVHDINFASAYADRIVALVDGQIRFDCSANEAMQSGRLSSAFGTQVDLLQAHGYQVADYYRPHPAVAKRNLDLDGVERR